MRRASPSCRGPTASHRCCATCGHWFVALIVSDTHGDCATRGHAPAGFVEPASTRGHGFATHNHTPAGFVEHASTSGYDTRLRAHAGRDIDNTAQLSC